MPTRKSGLFDTLVLAPWPVGIAFGVVAFFVLRYGVAAWFGSFENPYTQGLAKGFAGGALAPLAWIVLVTGFVASGISLMTGARQRRLLETRTGLDSLRDISWRDFERLTAELFKRRGYAVEATGGGGADGGVDLMLRRDGSLELVQCKQWRRRQVPVSTAREAYGLLQHHGASKAWIVCCGGFTPDARSFVAGKPIELISGTALHEAIRQVQSAPTPERFSPIDETAIPACPACSKPMLQRKNRRNGEEFWGCPAYPSCRGTRSIPQTMARTPT